MSEGWWAHLAGRVAARKARGSGGCCEAVRAREGSWGVSGRWGTPSGCDLRRTRVRGRDRR
jgi:hypothetical protein